MLYPETKAAASALLAVLRGIGNPVAYAVAFPDRPAPLVYGQHGPERPPVAKPRPIVPASTPSAGKVKSAAQATAAAPARTLSADDNAIRADAISALCNLGYKQPVAVAAVNAAVAKLASPLDLATVIKGALAKPGKAAPAPQHGPEPPEPEPPPLAVAPVVTLEPEPPAPPERPPDTG